MPTYVYACDTCGAQLEQFQSFKDEPLRTCPSCAGALRRVFQPVGIVFKGSGWYITDSRKNGSVTASGEDSSGKSDKSETTTTSEASSKSETTTTSEASSKSDSATNTKNSSASKPATD